MKRWRRGDHHARALYDEKVLCRKSYRIAALTALLVAGGCTEITEYEAETVVTYSAWVPWSAALACVGLSVVGWPLRRRRGRLGELGFGLIGTGILMLILVPPSLWRDRIALTQEGFVVRTGFWGMTSVHDVRFADLTRIHMVEREKNGRTGHYMVCQTRTGQVREVPFNSALTRAAFEHVIKAGMRAGIPIEGLPVAWNPNP